MPSNFCVNAENPTVAVTVTVLPVAQGDGLHDMTVTVVPPGPFVVTVELAVLRAVGWTLA